MTSSQAERDRLQAMLDETLAWKDAMPAVADAETTKEFYARLAKVTEAVRAAPPGAIPVVVPFLAHSNLDVAICRGLSASHASEAAELLVSEAEHGRGVPLARFASNMSYDGLDDLRRELGARVERVKQAIAKLDGGDAASVKKLVTSLEGLSPRQIQNLRKGLQAGGTKADKAYKTFCNAAQPVFDPRLGELVPDVVAACRRGMQTNAGRTRSWGSAISTLASAARVIDMDPAFFLELRACVPESNEAEAALTGLKWIARRLEAAGRQEDADALRAKYATK